MTPYTTPYTLPPMVSGPSTSSPDNFSQTATAAGPFERGRHALRSLWGRLRRRSPRQLPPAPAAPRTADRQGDLDLAVLGRALQRALDQHPRSRSMLRHLAIFEKAFRRHGAGVLEKLPTSFLYRVSLQLDGIAADEALRRLATLIGQTLAHRTREAERELAFVSSLEFTSQVEVEEFTGDDALREFSMLWKRGRAAAPEAAASAPYLQRPDDDWPCTQPSLP